jgi:predicted DCC family thiol-disulfide oxidoreductase YuxK
VKTVKQVKQLPVGMRRVSLLLVIGCLSVGLWLAFARLAVPLVIESVYRGKNFSFLNALIRGQSEFDVTYYLYKWNNVIAPQVLWAILAFWILSVLTTSQYFSRKIVGEATPGTLGAIRMWTCAILLITTLWDDLGSIAFLPLEYRVNVWAPDWPSGGLMKVLHEVPIGFELFLTSESSLRWFQRVTELLLFLGVIGWRTRIVIPLCALCAFVANGILREYSAMWHQNLVPIYVLMVLSFVPCGDGWSIDRLRRIYQGRSVPDAERASPVYGWARYACWVPIALTYASAGLSKLRFSGIGWMGATNMRGLLYEQTLYPRAGNHSISLHLAGAPDFVFVILGVTALFGEALFVTVLFSRTSRRILPAVGMLMHVGIVFLQNIVFFDLTLLLFIFYDFTALRETIGRWMRRAGPIQVLYDGMCPFCLRTVRVLRSLDLFRRLEFEDFRGLDLGDFNHRHRAGLTLATLENEMFVRSAGKSYSGFTAYRALALALPALWPVAPWLFIPGAVTLGNAAYGFIARHRLGLAKCDLACPTDSADTQRVLPGPARDSRRYVFGWGMAVAAVIAVQGFVWFDRIEYYPLTAVQMFTGRTGTVVWYYKTLGHWESGRVSPVYLEDSLAFMSINSRYEPLFVLCFGDANHIALCRKTLSILGSAYNDRARSRDNLTHLEIQRWRWDFGSRPRDPDHGEIDARLVAEVPIGGRSQASLVKQVTIEK